MKKTLIFISVWALYIAAEPSAEMPDCYKHVDQVLWVVSDVENTMAKYKELGFTQFVDMGQVEVKSESKAYQEKVRMVCANLGNANVTWIQTLEGESIFRDFHKAHGDAAMSLVHRFPDANGLKKETGRLESFGVKVLDELTIDTGKEKLHFVLMDTQQEGKYILGFTYGDMGSETHSAMNGGNRNSMKLNQYAFAIRDPEPVSKFWQKLGLPELQINHPELGNPMYYGEPADHDLIQGWQRHGTISYEWCIPVKPPIVYEDHIQKHGEGIHHLAFSVNDMDKVLEDYTSRGFVVSMGGTWGEVGKPGSGRYEYIDLEKAGGLTMELLWNL